MTKVNLCPSEEDEESTLSDYCELHHYNHWHCPNETYTTSWKQKSKNKRLGVKSGVSDHWVRVSTPMQERLFVFEMKKKHGNTPTDEQIAFIRDMNKVDNVFACCAYGADEAIAVIEEILLNNYDTYYKLLDRMEKIAEKRKNLAKKRKIKEKNTLPY